MIEKILIRGAKVHNLKNIDVDMIQQFGLNNSLIIKKNMYRLLN